LTARGVVSRSQPPSAARQDSSVAHVPPPSTAIQAQPEGEATTSALYAKIALRCIFPATGRKRHREDKFQFVDASIARLLSSPRKTKSQNPAIVSIGECLQGVISRVARRRHPAGLAATIRLNQRRLGQSFGPVALSIQYRVCSSVQPGIA
jgi:hypothetical protein